MAKKDIDEQLRRMESELRDRHAAERLLFVSTYTSHIEMMIMIIIIIIMRLSHGHDN
jgi:hypothetical protein